MNTKLVRVESIVDAALAWLISLPAPLTSVAIIVYTVLAVYVGSRL